MRHKLLKPLPCLSYTTYTTREIRSYLFVCDVDVFQPWRERDLTRVHGASLVALEAPHGLVTAAPTVVEEPDSTPL